MVAVSIQQMADRVSDLLGQRYRVSGSFTARIAKASRRFSNKERQAMELLAAAAHMAQNPRLAPQIDMEQVAAAYDLALKHLNGVDRADRWRGLAVGMAGSIAFSLLAVVVLVVVVLRWRGYL